MPAIRPSAEPTIGSARSAAILTRLKKATRERHDALERHVSQLDPALSRDAYRRFLSRFFGYYAPLEVHLYASPQWHDIDLIYSERRKTPRLALDLIALGTPPDALADLPHCHELPDVASSPRLFGCLYVIESATLGWRTITRRLRQNLGLTPQRGASFFDGYGVQTGPRWQAFGAQLTAFVQRSGDAEEVIAGANQTLATIDGWLSPKRFARQPLQ